jgi:hypothetical protein
MEKTMVKHGGHYNLKKHYKVNLGLKEVKQLKDFI